MEGLGMPEGFDEAIYLIEINDCVKDYLRKVMKPQGQVHHYFWKGCLESRDFDWNSNSNTRKHSFRRHKASKERSSC
ncbi:hypothetical protein TVAG_480470 [Trichomonas vaginalis G3]|uniref:Uncharacterized protein n=1 Tax=Trichomonas vaginalis (strain ATCC PRA-98 / G3) TaxID=412133 RepID=A2H2F9_TRIV3|nr:hypothetical protein TVAGG3_0233210 [Trichomonas vaginalis G3]EAX76408.1 hypothetical protein TVAG_480470 [Trichomonas vaginalis G3]KAI5552799.1 hypothetical protein TVAGG3_0233210 [Trichomonas vaginalis G3]|eukprot:XP_001289338.1 hypothetical protein [Trichomonas vaginalis G3]